MSNIYYLRNNQDPVSFEVQIGTIGNPATNVTLRRSGSSVKKVSVTLDATTAPASPPGDTNTPVPLDPDRATFNIPPTRLGISAELVGATMVVTLAVLFTAQDDLKQALAGLTMTVYLSGGLDGTQSYTLQDSDKTLYAGQLLIVASQAIKLQTN